MTKTFTSFNQLPLRKALLTAIGGIKTKETHLTGVSPTSSKKTTNYTKKLKQLMYVI